MKNINISGNPKKEILDKLKRQTSIVETFLNETKEVNSLSEKDLSARYEVFVADDGSEISVRDKGLNVPVFTISNTFVKGGDHYTVVFTTAFDKARYPKTVEATTAA